MSDAEPAAEAGVSGDRSEKEPPKRKRGRPRKPKPEQTEESKPKRPRGRPPGSKAKPDSKKEYQPKKPRGRPLKLRGGSVPDDQDNGDGRAAV